MQKIESNKLNSFNLIVGIHKTKNRVSDGFIYRENIYLMNEKFLILFLIRYTNLGSITL